MLINGWNASNAEAKQWTVTKGAASISNSSEWPNGSIGPTLLESNAGFKELKLVFMVYGNSREQIHKNISLLTSKFVGIAELTLDNWTNKFKGVLKNTPTISEWTAWKKRCAKVTYTLQGYEYGPEATYSGKNSITFVNSGTAPTPAVITISGVQAAGTVKIEGLQEDIEIPVAAGHEYIIDGETGIFTDNGTLMNVDIWELPYAKSGQNVLSISSSFVTISVKIRPRYY